MKAQGNRDHAFSSSLLGFGLFDSDVLREKLGDFGVVASLLRLKLVHLPLCRRKPIRQAHNPLAQYRTLDSMNLNDSVLVSLDAMQIKA